MSSLYRFPTNPADCADIPTAIERYVLPGHVPERPFLTRSDPVAAAGSCFAEHIATSLREAGVPVAHLEYKEGFNTPAATDVLVERALSNPIPELRLAAEVLRTARLVVITHGVALTPFDSSGPVTEGSRTNAHKLHYRMLAAEEIERYTLSTIARIRAHNNTANFVLTISPLPLAATIGAQSVFTEDCLSKSLLKVGVDAVMNRGIDGVYYWPSFEMVRWLSPHVGAFFGVDGSDNRHIPKSLIATITQLFVRHYFA